MSVSVGPLRLHRTWNSLAVILWLVPRNSKSATTMSGNHSVASAASNCATTSASCRPPRMALFHGVVACMFGNSRKRGSMAG